MHPNEPETLVVTFMEINWTDCFNGFGFRVNNRVGVCNNAKTGDLSSGNNWRFPVPKQMDGGNFEIAPTVHPLIDPISPTSGSYWLFIVVTNHDFSGFGGNVGFQAYRYSLNNRELPTSLIANQQIRQPLNMLLFAAPGTAIERSLRVYDDRINGRGNNIAKAALSYCNQSSHKMYIPTTANSNNVSSNLYVTIWDYTGGTPLVTQEILPNQRQKYIPCAVTDGHGRVWINAFIVTVSGSIEQAQIGAIAINRDTAVPGEIAFMSMRLPMNTGNPPFLGDYVYTDAAYYSSNGFSRVASPTLTDSTFVCGGNNEMWITNSGWK